MLNNLICNQHTSSRLIIKDVLKTSICYLHHKKSSSSKIERKMSAWQLHSYGDEIQFSNKVKIPAIQSPNDVLIKVTATSINPIDIAMTKGYGSTLFKAMRCDTNAVEFPLIFGREFTGTVKQMGMNVDECLRIGSSVWGVVEPHKTGCHAEYVVVNANNVSVMPETLSPVDASAVLYGALTAWSGLFISGNLGGLCAALSADGGGGNGKKVCILGGSGSVGSMAIQIAKHENALVIATCATDAIEMVRSIGADNVIDYTCDEYSKELISHGPYDIIMDCAGLGAQYSAQFPWKYCNYVTFTSPLLRNVDKYGVCFGMAKNAADLIETNWKSLTSQKGLVKWAYFMPAPHGITYLTNLVNKGKLKPLIQTVIDFKTANEGYQRVAEGHLRGKVVLKM